MTRRFIWWTAACGCVLLLLEGVATPWQSRPAGPMLLAAETGSAEEGAEFPAALTQWRPYEGNPVFAASGPGHWDVRIRERGWVLHEETGYRLWFTGYDGTREGQKKLGYAESDDGIHWQRATPLPLYDAQWVEDMQVIHHGESYTMVAEGLHDRAQLLTSPDGLHWTRQGELDVRYTDGRPLSAGPFGTPTLWIEGDVWHLFYERLDQGIWLATSRDRRVWTNLQDEPILIPGPGEYDDAAIALNQIVRYEGRYYAMYHGAGKRDRSQWSTCLAVSPDLVHWKKYPQNPLLGENKSSGILVADGTSFRLYTMHDRVQLHLPAEE